MLTAVRTRSSLGYDSVSLAIGGQRHDITGDQTVLPPWRRRVLLYRLIDALPRGAWLLNWYRLRLGAIKHADLGQRRTEVQEMLHILRDVPFSVGGKDLVEVGAGWHPMLPAILRGMGARSIVMTDLSRHMTGSTVKSTIEYLLAHASGFADVTRCPENELAERWSALLPDGRDWTQVWQNQGITYRAPLDFTRSQLPSGSADLVYSNSCLNYVQAPILRSIMVESVRILRPGGFIAHNIHVYDDLAGRDPSLRPWNFLRYGADEWQQVGNAASHHQNRWRPQDYFDLAEGSGMEVLHTERVPVAMNAWDIDRSDLHLDFRNLPAEEITCSHYLLVAQKPGSAPSEPCTPTEQAPVS